MRLRPAVAADAAAVAALFTASRGTLTFLPVLHSSDEDHTFIRDHVLATMRVTLAEDDAGLAGFIAETPGWIEHLYLAPERRCAGVGTLLVEVAEAHQHELTLWCFAANSAARSFYERRGFVAVEHTDGRGNEAGLPDIRYRWSR